MSTFTVKTCSLKKELPDNGHGAKKVLHLTLVDSSGVETQAEWFTNATTPNPEPGSRLEGTLEASDYGPKFKKAQQGQGQRGSIWTPEREAAVTRQHSQHMALLYAQIRAGQGKLPETFEIHDLAAIADWFDRDVDRAKRLAGTLPARTTSDVPVPRPDEFRHPQVTPEQIADAFPGSTVENA